MSPKILFNNLKGQYLGQHSPEKQALGGGSSTLTVFVTCLPLEHRKCLEAASTCRPSQWASHITWLALGKQAQVTHLCGYSDVAAS